MKVKIPILTPQQKAQILGDQLPHGMVSQRVVLIIKQIKVAIAQLEREKFWRSRNA